MYFQNQQQVQPGVYQPYGMGGAAYAPIQQAKMTQVLTDEEIKELRRTGSGFTLNIPGVEFTRAKCTHKDHGQFATVDNGDGTHTCTICGERFRIVEYGPEEAQEVVDRFLDLFQSTKLFYVNMPESYIENITQMIPIIKQVPELYRIAYNDFNKYENGGTGLTQRGGMYGANLLNAVIQPNMVYPQQQMMYPQQPQYYPQQQMQYAQPQQGYYDPQQMMYPQQAGQYPTPQGVSNGFGYAAPQQVQPQQVQQQQPQQQQAQTVQGGQGVSFTKENAAKTTDVNTTKIYNS